MGYMVKSIHPSSWEDIGLNHTSAASRVKLFLLYELREGSGHISFGDHSIPRI